MGTLPSGVFSLVANKITQKYLLSPGRLCRNPILMVAAGFSLRATH